LNEESLPVTPQSLVAKSPSFPQRVSQSFVHLENPTIGELITQLKKMIVKIPLVDALMEIPTYTNDIKEACIKKPGRK
jgi:hypothetical protein